MEYLIKTAEAADEPRINELFVEMLCSIYETDTAEGYTDGQLNRYFSSGEDRIFIAEAEGVLAAFLSLEVHREEEAFIYYDDFSVSAPWRGKGLGTALIAAAEAYCRSLGIKRTVLHVEEANLRALRLYKRLGFTVLRREGTRLRMVKTLDDTGRIST